MLQSTEINYLNQISVSSYFLKLIRQFAFLLEFSPSDMFFQLVCASLFKDHFDSLKWKKSQEDGIMTIKKHNLLDIKGFQTTTDYKFYHYLTPVDATPAFPSKKDSLILQFAVTFEQDIDCGGGYLKVIPTTPLKEFNSDSKYHIMFGPDICGPTKKVHFIIHYKGENHQLKHHLSAPHDTLMHIYTLEITGKQEYKVYVDNKVIKEGKIVDDFDVLPPKQILDPKAKKPEDWDDRMKIDDPKDEKPDDWDNVEQYIDDPDAEKPENWDDEMDGTWEPAQIVNPEYKGEWKAKQIDNPKYKGEW
eukprot:NODE_434_length_7483_cov_0.351165.p2 type:complete len:304 gc:universal NODE_434_length_7483_cov_0.351165:3565-4476(+)